MVGTVRVHEDPRPREHLDGSFEVAVLEPHRVRVDVRRRALLPAAIQALDDYGHAAWPMRRRVWQERLPAAKLRSNAGLANGIGVSFGGGRRIVHLSPPYRVFHERLVEVGGR